MLGVIGLLAAVAAAAAVRALGVRRRSEALLAFFVLAGVIVLVPVHGLGLAGALTRPALAGASVACCAAVIAAAARAATLGAILRFLPRAPFAIARLWWRALAAAVRRKSPAALAIATATAIVALSIAQGYVLPSDSWDGIWYHDTMVGRALEAASYAPMDLPPNLVQQANGFPRNAEMTSLWLAALSDRRVVEWTNTLAAVPFALGTYVILRRFTRSRVDAAGWASVAVLVPGAALQLRSTLVDVYAAAAFVAAVHFTTKDRFRARDAVLAACALALLIGAKTSALVVVPILGGLAIARLARAGRSGSALRTAMLALVLAALVGAFGAVTYVRNWLTFGNPLWPYGVDAFGWPGIVAASEVDFNEGALTALASFWTWHEPGRDFADIRAAGFGFGFGLVVMPLAALGLAAAARRALSAARPRSAAWIERARSRWLLVVLAAPLVSFASSPAIWSARYNLAAAALLPAALLWLLRDRRWALARAAALAVVAGLHALHLARAAPPLGGASLATTLSYVPLSAAERAHGPIAPWTIAPEVAAARERELGPGAVVAFGPMVTFPSVLYTERFDNRLVYVPEQTPAAMARRLASVRPDWIVASPDEPLYRFAAQRPEDWELVGAASRGQPTYAFRRRRAGLVTTHTPAVPAN